MARIKLLRNKREAQVKQMRREISQLLTSGQEPSARIRVEHIIREQNILAAYDILELFCELVVVRLPIIESQKICPLDLKEAISSLIFASPRCSDLPELLQIRQLFAAKYGKEFAAAAAELRPDCGVNRRIIEKLSVRAPSGELKLKLMKEIAAEHDVDWDPTATEEELLKAPEDLLDGPNHFVAASDLLSPQLDDSRINATPDDSTEVPTITMSQMPSNLVGLSSTASSSEDEGQLRVPVKKISSPTKNEPPSSLSPPRNVESGGRKVEQMLHTPKRDIHSGVRPVTKEDRNVDTVREGQGDYSDVASAAKAAAESANRAVAAARAAAELAKTQGIHDSKVPISTGMQDSRAAAEDEDSVTDLDSDEEDERNIPVEPPVRRGRHVQETKRAPAGYSDSDGESDTAEYDVPYGRGAAGTNQRFNAAYERSEAPEVFTEQKLPSRETKLDFQKIDANRKPVFYDDDADDDGSADENTESPRSRRQIFDGSSSSKYKRGGLKWISKEEPKQESAEDLDRYDIFDVNRDKSTLRYSAFDSSDHVDGNYGTDQYSSRREETYSSYDRPSAGKSDNLKFSRDSSPLFDEEGSVGRAHQPSRFGSLPQKPHYDYDEDHASLFSSTQKYDESGMDFPSTGGVFDRDPSPKVIESEDDLVARFEALKQAKRR